jgi:hypothetical protein
MIELDLVGYKDGAEVERRHLDEVREPKQICYSFGDPLWISGPGIAQARVEERGTGDVLLVLDVGYGIEADLHHGDVLTIESPVRVIWSGVALS